MCYPCTHCNKCGREPEPGRCPRCGYANGLGAQICTRCGALFPRPPGPPPERKAADRTERVS
ncbi:zinc-ribbon domain-containing protein [Raoultibacter phocaeensis]|uniref:zinc-ribbon domain-containing protein n=1 Tax=Raoultibacter phocaeensis TaxID=2479841 RepID=UPI003F719D6D